MALGASVLWVRGLGCTSPSQLGAAVCPPVQGQEDIPQSLAVPMRAALERTMCCGEAVPRDWLGLVASPGGSQPGLVASPGGSQPGHCVSKHFILVILTAAPQIPS